MGCATSTCEACFAAISSGGSSSSGSGGGGGLSANPPCCFDRRYLSTNLTVTEARSVIEAPPGESGIALADTPIDQLRAFWEFRLRAFDRDAGASFAVGVVRRANLKPPPNDQGVFSSGRPLGTDARSKALQASECGVQFSVNDVIGVSLDMNYKRMKFYLNGIKMDFELKLGPKFSAPYPALSIANGARIEANFSGSIEEGKAWHAFPEECGDYSGIVAARQLL
jgi:hypothetical protein